jgi:outer membrane receptor for ferrienterochelin and colicins
MDLVFQNGTSTERATNYFQWTLFYEDRWGGELQWEKNTVEVAKYMAKIYTKRWELLVLTNFLLRKKMLFSFHIQITTKTVYGNILT